MSKNRQSWLQKLNRKFGRYSINNLMLYIVIGIGAVFVLQLFLQPAGVNIGGLLAFNTAAIRQLQIWRLISFIFLPPNYSLLFIFFSLYFYWMIGSALENEWGAFKFNVFYLCGMLGTMLAGLITGFATNEYINMSLFFAFALLYPDYKIMLFFVLPIKMKYLAMVDALFFLYTLIYNQYGWAGRIALVLSLLNIALFFGGDAKNRILQMYRRAQWKRNMRR